MYPPKLRNTLSRSRLKPIWSDSPRIMTILDTGWPSLSGRTASSNECGPKWNSSSSPTRSHMQAIRGIFILLRASFTMYSSGEKSSGRSARILFWLGGPRILCGAFLECALVYHKDRVLKRGGLCLPDKPKHHRMLDCVGDMALAGASLRARVVSESPCRRANCRLLVPFHAERVAMRSTDRAQGTAA